MLRTRSVVSIFSIAIMILGASVVSGQNFPNKPIRILTGSAGGGNDAASRLIAGGISGSLGQPVIVENRNSAVLSAEVVANAPPDGYTLLLAGDLLWLGPLLRGQTDAIRDFSPISILLITPNILVVHPSLPVKSVKELIALAKARPGELNYASAPEGSPDHIAGELFKSMTGVNIVNVHYKGSATVTAVAGGEVQLMFGGVFLVSAHIKSGRLRALAVTSTHPSALVPGLPTVAASGLPGYEVVSFISMWAPAKTPVAIVNQLNREIVRFLGTTEAKYKYLNLGVEVVASSPEEHAAKIKSRITVIGKLIKDAGIKVD